MRHFRRLSGMLWIALLVPGSGSADESARLLWRIGRADDDTAEFALARQGYGGFSRDGLFLVGHSDPARDWPYAHPGPADAWAGSRGHAFTVLFALAAAPEGGRASLTIDLTDTHPLRPPTLVVEVNGLEHEHVTPAGGADASIMGDPSAGKEHVFTVSFPVAQLKEGLNEIRIRNESGSWVLYDWLGLEVDGETPLELVGATVIRSGVTSSYLIRHGGLLWQPTTVTIAHLGEPVDATLHVAGATPLTVHLQPGMNSVSVQAPPVEREGDTPLELRQGDEVLHRTVLRRSPAVQRDPVDYVDPMLGTSTSRWMLYPGPSTPFSMVKLSPDNQEHGWKAGYEYTIGNIAGFSHIHSWTMGGLLTVPTTGPLAIVPGPQDDPDAGYRSRFRHETEIAAPGYYAVTLDDSGVRAELTSSTRAGFQRYTFPRAGEARILVDLLTPTEYNFDVLEAAVRRVSDREIEGFSRQRGGSWARWNDYTVHFVARVDRPFQRFGGWVGDEIHRDVGEVSGAGDVGAFLEYSTADGDVIQLQTAISLVSIEQARLNLETELGHFGQDFDAVRRRARATWNELLEAITVEGGRETDRVKFYTNMYRSYCSRTIWSDVNGKYVDMYEKVQQLQDPDSPVYGCDAFWNTFWNLNQLWTLAHPGIASKWVRSLLEISDRGGWLAKGPTGIEYSSIMVASHEIALIVSAYQKGIRDFDVDKAYRAMRFIQTVPGRPHEGGGHVGNRQLAAYMKYGFVPVEDGPVSNTLEYAYDDWCVAQLARALGKEDDYDLFMERSRHYRNVFDRSVGYMRQRHRDGRWVEGFSPFSGAGFVEGNSWQFTWFAPHDVAGLIELLGRDEFNRRLDKGLSDSAASDFNATNDRFADFPINHGNQPNMQSSWLFNYSGRPWLTQKWTREILNRYYGTGPIDGYPGDEDQGQMGAWFVMAAMGLFQMDGGCSVRPVYEIGSPLFDRVTIRLDPRYYPGGVFVVETQENSPENVYIQSATLDGETLDRPWLYHSDLVDGGKLVLRMGPRPNTAWGSAPGAAPPQQAR